MSFLRHVLPLHHTSAYSIHMLHNLLSTVLLIEVRELSRKLFSTFLCKQKILLQYTFLPVYCYSNWVQMDDLQKKIDRLYNCMHILLSRKILQWWQISLIYLYDVNDQLICVMFLGSDLKFWNHFHDHFGLCPTSISLHVSLKI